jgi:hypothetical protein
MKITLTPEQVAAVVGEVAAKKTADVVDDSIVYPYRDPAAQGHLFTSREEHEAWKTAVKIRNTNLDINDARDPNEGYSGALNPDTLDRLDWAFFSQNRSLWSRQYTLFDRHPWIGVRATGYLYHPGDLASADLSGYYAAGSKFGPYL